jgi:hypothetical protein
MVLKKNILDIKQYKKIYSEVLCRYLIAIDTDFVLSTLKKPITCIMPNVAPAYHHSSECSKAPAPFSCNIKVQMKGSRQLMSLLA